MCVRERSCPPHMQICQYSEPVESVSKLAQALLPDWASAEAKPHALQLRTTKCRAEWFGTPFVPPAGLPRHKV